MHLSPEERLNWIISQIIEDFKLTGKPRQAPEVFEVALIERQIIKDDQICLVCFERGLYEFVRKAIQKDPVIIRQEKTRQERLEELNVPHAQRKIILKLGMDNARCPLRNDAYVNLYGPDRGTADEILSAANAYAPHIKVMQEKRALLTRLSNLVRAEENNI